MSKKRKIIIAVVVAACVLLAAAGILAWYLLKGRGEQIAQAENTYDSVYHSFCSYEHDPEISIDGVLDEAAWQGKKWLVNTYATNINGDQPWIEVTGFTDEKGVYIASVVKDTNLRHNGERAPLANSSWDLRVTADNVGEERSTSTVWQSWFVIDMKGQDFGYRTNFDRAVKVEGELNSGNTTSGTLEMFVPWETLGIDTSRGIPETFRIYPSYYGCLPGGSRTNNLILISMPEQTKDYYLFGKDGYATADREGAVVGDSVIGYAKSGNWDVSRESEGIVQSSPGTEHHQIFFKGQYGNNFILETKISYVKSLENDWPKAGFLFKALDATWYTAYLDLNNSLVSDGANGLKNVDTLMLTTVDHTWDWRSRTEFNRPNTAADKTEVKLTVLKYGSRFYYFINDTYFTSEEISFMDKNVIPGLYSLGADVIYKDYSCKELTEDMLREYLKGQDVCMIDVNVDGLGGQAQSSAVSVEKGESYNIFLTSNSGYEVSSIVINGEERIADARKNALNGYYTISNVRENQEVHVSFAECGEATLSGTLSLVDGAYNKPVWITATGKTNGTLFYETTETDAFSFRLPEGRYELFACTDGYKSVVHTVEVKGDTVKDISLDPSAFPASVEIGGRNVQWAKHIWNLNEEHLNYVTTSFASGGKMAPLYFKETAKDFVVQATIEYTTEFTADESAYQPDLMGGFVFTDGSKTGWVVAQTNGITYTNWQGMWGLRDISILTYPEKKSVTFTLAKEGKDAYLYLDGRQVLQIDWKELTGGLNPDQEAAVGLYMIADKTADIRFSNYSVKTGTAAAKSYIAEHVVRDTPSPENPMFADILTVGGTRLMSSRLSWDLTEAANGVAKTSYAKGGKAVPMYFWEHGSTALLHTTIEYTTEFVGSEEEYQPDLMGGFMFHDGRSSGWIITGNTGIITTNWQFKQGLIPYHVLHYPDKRKVDMTVAMRGNYFYVYLDDVFVSKLPISRVIPTAKEGSDLAFSLFMIADKTADARFSNISISTDASVVDEYIRQHK